MMEYDMKRNGSGYYDETPVKSGVFNSPQAGEIWETTMGKEYLILKNHGGYCNTLLLRDHTTHADNIEVVSHDVRWVNPVMIGYLANKEISQFVKAVPEDKYMEVMEAIGERLGVTIKVSRAEGKDLTTQADREAWDEERKALKDHLFEVNMKCNALEAQRDGLLDELEKEHMKLNAVKANVEATAQVIRTAEEKAALYEKMYTALLDRIFARGEAK